MFLPWAVTVSLVQHNHVVSLPPPPPPKKKKKKNIYIYIYIYIYIKVLLLPFDIKDRISPTKIL